MNPLTVQIDILGLWGIFLFIGTVCCSVFLIKNHSSRLPMSATLLWIYVVISALYIAEFPALPFADFNTAFKQTAGLTVIEVMLIPMMLLSLRDQTVVKILAHLKWVMLLEIILIWIKRPGLMIAPSFDTAYLALYIPFAPVWLIALSLITIATHHGTTALLILSVQAIIYIARNEKLRKLIIPGFPLLIVGSYFLQKNPYGGISSMFSSSERLEHYRHYFSFWIKTWEFMVLGTGPGSFMWLSLMLDKFAGTLYLHMHSDMLQILFETGAIGLILTITYVISTIKRVWEDTTLLAATLSCVVFALTYHPLRFFPTILLIGLIFRRGVKATRYDQIA